MLILTRKPDGTPASVYPQAADWQAKEVWDEARAKGVDVAHAFVAAVHEQPRAREYACWLAGVPLPHSLVEDGDGYRCVSCGWRGDEPDSHRPASQYGELLMSDRCVNGEHELCNWAWSQGGGEPRSTTRGGCECACHAEVFTHPLRRDMGTYWS